MSNDPESSKDETFVPRPERHGLPSGDKSEFDDYENNRQLESTFVSGLTPDTKLADRYVLIEKIGEGGMGEVWIARQAVTDWDRALELNTDDMSEDYRSARIDSRIRSGAVAESIDELSELTKVENSNATHWFNFARLYAIAGKSIPERSVEVLDSSNPAAPKGCVAWFQRPRAAYERRRPATT